MLVFSSFEHITHWLYGELKLCKFTVVENGYPKITACNPWQHKNQELKILASVFARSDECEQRTPTSPRQ